MVKKYLLGLMGVLLFLSSKAQNPNYNTNLIPKELQANAGAVIRQEQSTVEVKALDQVIYKHKKAITILNNNGSEYANIHIFYDKSSPIKSLRAALYDNSGKLIRKIGASDFQDVSAISDISLFEDDRVKYYTPQVSQLPFTVEYEYETRHKYTLFFPKWIPQQATDIAVEKSSFQFISRPDFVVRLKEFNLSAPHQVSNSAGLQVLTWEASNIPAIKPEPFSPPAHEFLTMVQIAPVNFSYEGITGKFTNWQEYGQWIYNNLLTGRDQLPAATVLEIKELVKNTSSAYERVKKVYEFAQQKNRYISVQVGIGGLQPMKAEEVDRLSYGDCKALTNYTKALLQVAGIPSIYTEVNSGYTKTSYFKDFASAGQGNHVILCVPMPKDTLWLECTSREAPVGYLGTFTDDRQVLLCTEKGGIITRTPQYSSALNRQIRQATFTIDEKGLLEGSFETRFEGTQYDNREGILQKKGNERQNQLKEIYPVNNLELLAYDLKQEKSNLPYTIEKVKIKATNYGTLNNNMLFIPAFKLSNEISVPKEIRNRKQKVLVQRGFYDEDVINYTLPAGFNPEYVPSPISLKTDFGTYSAYAILTGNQLIFTRKLLLNQGEFAPEHYEKLQNFLKKIVDTDNQKIVLVKI